MGGNQLISTTLMLSEWEIIEKRSITQEEDLWLYVEFVTRKFTLKDLLNLLTNDC